MEMNLNADMNIYALVADARLMLRDPLHEQEVMDLLFGLDSDVLGPDDELTPTGRIYHLLKEMGEDDVANNIVLPIYRKELDGLSKDVPSHD